VHSSDIDFIDDSKLEEQDEAELSALVEAQDTAELAALESILPNGLDRCQCGSAKDIDAQLCFDCMH
tara:strand:+ start:1346 stop:1546 length:201 start_codon:yes stop_codon:yes gene_type:complete